MPKARKIAASKPAKRHTAKRGDGARASKQQKRPAKRVAPRVSPKVRDGGAARPSSKKAIIVALLQRPDGAPISELTSATGWQAHSVRAALTGLRKQGQELTRTRDATGITHYRLLAAA
jgi:hypothetical protein